MDSLSGSQSANLDRVINPLTAEEEAEEEKRLTISKIVQEARDLQALDLQALDLQDKIFKAPEGIQQYMFAHMSTESLIALSKITNPGTHSLEPIATSVRLFAVNEFNKKFNQEALLVNNKALLLDIDSKATTADILLSIELNEVEEELAPYIIKHKDSQFVDAEATETRLINLGEEARTQLLQNPNTYKYPFLVHFFRTHFKREYEAGLQRIFDTVRWNSSSLNNALKKNKDFMFIAVSQDGYALRYADEALQKDRDIVFAAVRQSGFALQFADEALRKDQEIVLAAVQQNGLALQFADEAFKKNKEIVLAAVQQQGFALAFADEAFKKDEKIALAAVSQDGEALKYVHETLRNDPKFMEKVREIERNRPWN